MAHSNVVVAADDAILAPLEAIGVHLLGVGGGCLSISLLQYILFSYSKHSKPSPSLSSSLFNPTMPPLARIVPALPTGGKAQG